MAVHKTSRSGLFLLELMIVILFFAVTSAVCVNLFVQAHLTSTAGGELTAATREVPVSYTHLRAAAPFYPTATAAFLQPAALRRKWRPGALPPLCR